MQLLSCANLSAIIFCQVIEGDFSGDISIRHNEYCLFFREDGGFIKTTKFFLFRAVKSRLIRTPKYCLNDIEPTLQFNHLIFNMLNK
jgi:hypothetical protein